MREIIFAAFLMIVIGVFNYRRYIKNSRKPIDPIVDDLLHEIAHAKSLEDFNYIYSKKHVLLSKAKRVMDAESLRLKIDNAIHKKLKELNKKEVRHEVVNAR